MYSSKVLLTQSSQSDEQLGVEHVAVMCLHVDPAALGPPPAPAPRPPPTHPGQHPAPLAAGEPPRPDAGAAGEEGAGG